MDVVTAYRIREREKQFQQWLNTMDSALHYEAHKDCQEYGIEDGTWLDDDIGTQDYNATVDEFKELMATALWDCYADLSKDIWREMK